MYSWHFSLWKCCWINVLCWSVNLWWPMIHVHRVWGQPFTRSRCRWCWRATWQKSCWRWTSRRSKARHPARSGSSQFPGDLVEPQPAGRATWASWTIHPAAPSILEVFRADQKAQEPSSHTKLSEINNQLQTFWPKQWPSLLEMNLGMKKGRCNHPSGRTQRLSEIRRWQSPWGHATRPAALAKAKGPCAVRQVAVGKSQEYPAPPKLQVKTVNTPPSKHRESQNSSGVSIGMMISYDFISPRNLSYVGQVLYCEAHMLDLPLASCIDDKSCPPQAWHSSASTKVWAPTWLGRGVCPYFCAWKAWNVQVFSWYIYI